MKARILEESIYAPQLKKEEIVEIVPGMETDAEGIWNVPAGKLFLCKKEDGTFAYTMPMLLQLLPEQEDDGWSAFRREAAKDILCSIIARKDTGYGSFSFDRAKVVASAIRISDELIKQLKEDQK